MKYISEEESKNQKLYHQWSKESLNTGEDICSTKKACLSEWNNAFKRKELKVRKKVLDATLKGKSPWNLC